MRTRYKNQAVILSIRITFDAPSHVFLNTFLASILRVGCPLQTTGLVVARARLQRQAGCVDLQHKFNSRHFVETVAEKQCWASQSSFYAAESVCL